MRWRTRCQDVLQWIADSNLSADNLWVCTSAVEPVYQPATNDYLYLRVEHCNPRKVFKDAVHITLYETGSENQTLG